MDQVYISNTRCRDSSPHQSQDNSTRSTSASRTVKKLAVCPRFFLRQRNITGPTGLLDSTCLVRIWGIDGNSAVKPIINHPIPSTMNILLYPKPILALGLPHQHIWGLTREFQQTSTIPMAFGLSIEVFKQSCHGFFLGAAGPQVGAVSERQSYPLGYD